MVTFFSRVFSKIDRLMQQRRGVYYLKCGYRMCITDRNEYIQKLIIKQGMYEPEIAAMVDAFVESGEVVYDIGANIGCQTLHAASRGAKVHAFEPIPRIADMLERNVHLNNLSDRITINRCAVSNADGDSIIHMAQRSDDGSHSLIPGVEASSITKINVTTVTLDSYLQSTRDHQPALIKIDVEGAECLVLDGAKEILKGSTEIIWIFETADRLSDRIGESAASVIRRFTTNGFSVFQITPDSSLKKVEANTDVRNLANYLAIHEAHSKFNWIRKYVHSS